MTFGVEKLELCGYPKVKNFEENFICFDRVHQRDGRTDTTWWYRPCYAQHRAARTVIWLLFCRYILQAISTLWIHSQGHTW